MSQVRLAFSCLAYCFYFAGILSRILNDNFGIRLNSGLDNNPSEHSSDNPAAISRGRSFKTIFIEASDVAE